MNYNIQVFLVTCTNQVQQGIKKIKSKSDIELRGVGEGGKFATPWGFL